MSLPNFKNDLELAAYAVANPGWRFTDREFVYWFDGLSFVFMKQEAPEEPPKKVSMSFGLDIEHEPYTEPKPAPRLVTWWQAKYYFHKHHTELLSDSSWYESKYQLHKENPSIKVLEWRSFEAPASYEECE